MRLKRVRYLLTERCINVQSLRANERLYITACRFIQSLAPVSYTHLDVYKRQRVFRRNFHRWQPHSGRPVTVVIYDNQQQIDNMICAHQLITLCKTAFGLWTWWCTKDYRRPRLQESVMTYQLTSTLKDWRVESVFRTAVHIRSQWIGLEMRTDCISTMARLKRQLMEWQHSRSNMFKSKVRSQGDDSCFPGWKRNRYAGLSWTQLNSN